MADTHPLVAEISRLNAMERHIIDRFIHRQRVARDISQISSSIGDRVADRVAAFGGSWTFIIIAIAAICGWMIINVIINKTFDPYPYIFLNLVVLFGSVASADHHDESESSVNPRPTGRPAR